MKYFSSKRVLILSYPFPPAMSGGVFRVLRFCKYLPDFGWEPIVVTPRTDSVYPIESDPTLGSLVPMGLHVVRTGVLRPSIRAKAEVRRLRRLFGAEKRETGGKMSVVGCQVSGEGSCETGQLTLTNDGPAMGGRRNRIRGLEALLFETPDRHVGWLPPAVAASLRVIRQQRPQAIYSTGPPHSTHLIAVTLKKITGLPVVLDFRDPWAAREWSAKERPTFQQRTAARLEQWCVEEAERVVVNTAAVKRRFEAVYDAKLHHKFKVVPNGIDPDLSNRVKQLVERAGVSRNGCVRLCHAGSAYGKRDLRPLAVALRLVANGGQAVSMEQLGPVGPGCRPTVQTGGEPLLQLVGSVPHEEALERMAAADILVLIQPDNTLQIPGKLYEMLPFRKPILTLAGHGATAEVVEEFRLGPVVDPKDPQAIAEGIRWASSDEARAAAARGFDKAIEVFDGRALTKRLAAEFDAIARR